MKATYVFLILTVSLYLSCGQEQDLLESYSDSDNIALAGMQDAYENTMRHNDSMYLCVNDIGKCDDDFVQHCDDLFHQYDAMYDLHHENYSHNNIGEDHHHEDNQYVHHEGMMNHDNDEHGYEHNTATYDMMMDLRESHELVHPE